MFNFFSAFRKFSLSMVLLYKVQVSWCNNLSKIGHFLFYEIHSTRSLKRSILCTSHNPKMRRGFLFTTHHSLHLQDRPSCHLVAPYDSGNERVYPVSFLLFNFLILRRRLISCRSFQDRPSCHVVAPYEDGNMRVYPHFFIF